ncbi:aldolase [Neobacillus cucumis]|uniref:aldolase n=1 Tax=Neobacillus cucumis TaxID=1740721 RepID=UPI001963BE7A|nr:aldolase [Neobacillus cucumis]MBM7651874.1 hypothetical protein [Neobacillus cucumis]
MLKTDEKVIYKAFGFSIISDIPMPELPNQDLKAEYIDVEIKIENLSRQWLDSVKDQNDFIINENLVMFRVPRIAIFLIKEGKRIIVSPLEEYDVDVARLYILGSCMGALLMQRKIFPLHGSVIAINGKAYAIIGESGAGKSTLASAFLNRGYQILTDDVIAISFSDGENIPYVTPSYPQQKLWSESLLEFGIDTEGYRPLYKRETKYAIPVGSKFYSEPLPLAGVFELIRSKDENIEIFPIQKLTRLQTLFSHTYRNTLISKLGLLDWHFRNSTSIVCKIDMYHLRRPVSSFTANQLVTLILSTIHKEEK